MTAAAPAAAAVSSCLQLLDKLSSLQTLQKPLHPPPRIFTTKTTCKSGITQAGELEVEKLEIYGDTNNVE